MIFIDNFIMLFTESAPFLLFGMLLAGLIHQYVPSSWVQKTLGSKNSVVTAALIGAPLPLCSCSVIPVAMGIRRSGASKSSTASFLVATPETGIDSIGITYGLMGPIMALARPIAAISSAIVTGLLIAVFGNEDKATVTESASCSSCCSSNKQSQSVSEERGGFIQTLVQAINFGFGKLLRDFMLWLLIGLFFAALITTFVPANIIAEYGKGVFAMLVVVLISVPMYICATASTPIAVGLMLSGVSPGAALVFMLTGPATNIATLMVIKNELGMRELVIYLISITVCALGCGLLLDYLVTLNGWTFDIQQAGHHGIEGLVFTVSAIILALIICYQMIKVHVVPRLQTASINSK